MAGTVCLAQYNTYKATRERETGEKVAHAAVWGHKRCVELAIQGPGRFVCTHTRLSSGFGEAKTFSLK